MLSPYLSHKIRCIQFILMFLIVYLHGYFPLITPDGGEFVNSSSAFIQNIISQEIARIAVPMFFIISGFLFFYSPPKNWHDYINKWRKRFKSLLIPYLLWSVMGLFLYFILQSIPFAKPYFLHKLIKDYSLHELMYTVLWQPVPYQLWFIRDLMIYSLITPAIYLLSKSKLVSILCIASIWIAGANFPFIKLHFLSFYFAGCLLALYRINIENMNYQGVARFIGIVWLVLVTIGAIHQTIHISDLGLIHQITILIGIFSAWYNFDLVENVFKGSLSVMLSFSFFVFCFHEPLLTIASLSLAGSPEIFSLSRYLLCPFLAFWLSVLAGYVLKNKLYRAYSLLTGGR